MSANTGVVNIRGKQYRTVGLRVNEFRQKYPATDGWAIQTTLVACDEKQAVVRAAIVDPQNRLVASGHAQEVWESTGVNSTSALENAETSAIGRALAAFGFAGEEFASADEVGRAIALQAGGKSNCPAETPQLPNYGRPITPAAVETPPFDSPRINDVFSDINARESSAKLVEFLTGEKDGERYNDAAVWENVCAAVAKRFREVDGGEKDGAARTELLGVLVAERARLDALKQPPTKADNVDPTPDKPKRGRPRKAA